MSYKFGGLNTIIVCVFFCQSGRLDGHISYCMILHLVPHLLFGKSTIQLMKFPQFQLRKLDQYQPYMKRFFKLKRADMKHTTMKIIYLDSQTIITKERSSQNKVIFLNCYGKKKQVHTFIYFLKEKSGSHAPAVELRHLLKV